MIKLITQTFLIISFFNISNIILAQTIIDDLSEDSETTISNSSLASEKIEKVSISKRIFILTNNERSFSKGDFISLILDDQLAVRAIAAKDSDNVSGIKIIKVYNNELWGRLKKGTEVKVLRGDDSFYRKEKSDSNIAETQINDEDDLFNDTVLTDDLEINENTKRIIKTDNLISLTLGRFEGKNNDGSSQRYNQLNAAWAYQIDDNIYIEGSYGQNLINDFPTLGLDTKVNNIIVRGKYTLRGPLETYFQPYIGFQVVTVESPGAGLEDPQDPRGDAALAIELQKVEDLEKKSVIFGATLLKRLVPGWFFRADLGTDIMSAGFSLEF